MLNTKQTLKNLHKKFPMMSLDELFEVLDCYVEESYLKTTLTNDTWKTTPGITSPAKILCDNQVTSISSQDVYPLNANEGITDRKF